LCASCPLLYCQALRAEATAYAWRPRHMLRSHDGQRAPRKLSVHAVALCSSCAHHAPHYTAQALRAREKRAVVLPHAFGLPAIVAGWTWCAKTTMHSPTHRRLRHALRRQRCTARPLFTRPAWPRRTLRSHDCQRAPRKLSVYAAALCSPCAYKARASAFVFLNTFLIRQ
jgi:hypothetical protein